MGSTKSAKRLNIDRRMVGIVSLFTLLGIGLLVMVIVATNSLSALSSYGYLHINWVETRKHDTLTLCIADDGIGLPDEFEKKQSKSLALMLVQSLTSQLECTCLISINGTTQFEIILD